MTHRKSIQWKRTIVLTAGMGLIALTAACNAQVSGAAATGGGVPAVAGAAPAITSTGAQGSEPTAALPSPSPSVSEPATSPNPTPENGDRSEPTAPPTEPASTSPATSTSDSPPSAKSAAGSADDYAFTKDYCLLMPKSAVTGLAKDATRDKTSTCTYQTPDSSKKLKIVSVTGGFSLSYEDLDQSYNVDLEKVKIDGRDGFTWTTSSKSLYSALFDFPGPDGGEMSILVVITDDGLSPAQMKAKAQALAAEVSKNVPR